MPDESEHRQISLSPKNPDDPWYFAEGAKYPTFIITKFVDKIDSSVLAIFPGYYFRKDHFGRIVIDICPSDPDHLRNPNIMNYERSLCRYLLEDLIPDHLLGKKGIWKISISYEENEEE